MATSPHQPQSLADKISQLKEELTELKQTRTQMRTLGQSSAGGGVSTTYPSYARVCEEIKWIEAQIEALTAQLNGDDVPAPGLNLFQTRSEYI